MRGWLPVLAVLLAALTSQRQGTAEIPRSELAGTWLGSAHYAEESADLIVALEPDAAGALRAFVSNPTLHMWRSPWGIAKVNASHVLVGPLDLVYDSSAGTLTTTLPDAIVPVHRLAVVFHRTDPIAPRDRAPITAPIVEPVWTHDVGSPIWSDPLVDGDRVWLGSDDGVLHALDVRTGQERWAFKAGGAIRARATRIDDDLVFPADDGWVYRIGTDGRERWRVRVSGRAAVRLSLGDRKSRYENRAAAVLVDGDRLYVGTNEGHLLCLQGKDGAQLWSFNARDSIVASPVIADGRVVVGSFDGHVYAVDARTGSAAWEFDTHAAVTSAAAAFDGSIIVGSRSYDLFALDSGSGQPRWSRYFWFSWVESPATIDAGVAYIGSSDAATLQAYDARSGKTLWRIDVWGSAWAQPAVSETTVYEGTAGATNYLIDHRATLLAVDRQTGKPIWQYRLEAPTSGAQDMVGYGFASAAALAGDLVVVGSIDGRVRAFHK